MIDYKLRQSISTLIVCLYDPKAENKFSTESLGNYVNDCAWQLETGEKVRRIPFHITPSKVDAQRAIMDMNRSIQASRKERINNRTGTTSPLLVNQGEVST